MIRIILLMDGVSEFDRKLLRGLVRYSKESGNFLFYRMPIAMGSARDEAGERIVTDWVRRWRADAIIGRWPMRDTSELEHLHIPVVLQNLDRRSEEFSNLTGDYFGTGEIAADFFFKRRFGNYAYFGVNGLIWSEERQQGFRSRVEKLGGRVNSLMLDVKDEHDDRRIVAWLKSLPKPVALFACDDSHALSISEACKMAGISIPDEVSLLGVDNDDLICEISDPPISSVSLDVEQGGFDVGKALHEMILQKSRTPFNVTIAPGAIIQRASTQRHNITDPYIGRLVKYIEDNYCQEISTAQILSQVPLSRRSLELKFKKEMGGITIYKYLTLCRIEYFAQLLATTNLPLTEIAVMAGISDYSNFSRIFKKHKGLSPQEYKRRKKLSIK